MGEPLLFILATKRLHANNHFHIEYINLYCTADVLLTSYNSCVIHIYIDGRQASSRCFYFRAYIHTKAACKWALVTIDVTWTLMFNR